MEATAIESFQSKFARRPISKASLELFRTTAGAFCREEGGGGGGEAGHQGGRVGGEGGSKKSGKLGSPAAPSSTTAAEELLRRAEISWKGEARRLPG